MKSVAILSGGLDSLVSLALAKKETDVIVALTFDYGQKAAAEEIKAASKIAKHYGITHKTIVLDWLKQITKTSLVNEKEEVPAVSEHDLTSKLEITQTSAKAVWVPNRNAVFVSIAASYAESLGAGLIVTGFNSEEAMTFPDNSIQFTSACNQLLRLSTLSKPKVISYVQSYNKCGIVNTGIKLAVPFGLIYSCYRGTARLPAGQAKKMCGRCESCSRTKKAFRDTGNFDMIKDRFPDEE